MPIIARFNRVSISDPCDVFYEVKLSNGNPCIATTYGKHGISGKTAVLMNGGWFQNAAFVADVIDETSFSLRGVDTSDLSQFKPENSLSSFSSKVYFDDISGLAFSLKITERFSRKNHEGMKIGNLVYEVELDYDGSVAHGLKEVLVGFSKRKSTSILLLQQADKSKAILGCNAIFVAVKTVCNGDLIQEAGKIASMRCRFYGLSPQTHYTSIE